MYTIFFSLAARNYTIYLSWSILRACTKLKKKRMIKCDTHDGR